MRVIVAVDGSGASQAALKIAKTHPWPAGSTIKVLSVAEPAYAPPPAMDGMAASYPYPDAAALTLQEHQLAAATKLAQSAAEELRLTGCVVEPVTDSGDPRDAIVNQANEWHADLIILGSHGRSGLKRWLLGSVAESVVRHAPCSVEVARVSAY